MSVTASVVQRFALAASALADDVEPVVLAVSGGSDSTALMHLAKAAFPQRRFVVVSVNHGLRPEAADEIAQVAAQAEKLGLAHHTETWQWDGKGNLQSAARAGRWGCLVHVARSYEASTIWMGHTEDDQVETALMRLARGSGVDGLTGMAPLSRRDGMIVGRPLIGFTRAALRDWLRDCAIQWSDDPSNEDPRFDRVRARQMFAQLQELGLTRKRLLQTVEHMQAAHVSLQRAAESFAFQHVRQDAGDLLLDQAVLQVDTADAPRRVLAAALGWVGAKAYRPRFDQLRGAAAQALNRRTVTLGGVVLTPEGTQSTRLTREAAATESVLVSASVQAEGQGINWDQRWYLEGPFEEGMRVCALGEGLRACPEWRETGVPRMSLLASPSVWRGNALLSAPLAGVTNGWSARIVADFHSRAFAIED